MRQPTRVLEMTIEGVTPAEFDQLSQFCGGDSGDAHLVDDELKYEHGDDDDKRIIEPKLSPTGRIHAVSRSGVGLKIEEVAWDDTQRTLTVKILLPISSSLKPDTGGPKGDVALCPARIPTAVFVALGIFPSEPTITKWG